MFDKLKADVTFINGDHKTSADMFYEGAREGDALAAFNYGYCLLKGLGREYDPQEAKSYFAFARDLEGGDATYNLAMLYLHGEGVAKNFDKALDNMIHSAEHGCVEAQLYLGMAYTTGCMFEPDINLICRIPYHKPEMRLDGSRLLSGLDFDEKENDRRYETVKADQKRAFEWFRAAARHDPTYVGELVAKGKYLYAKCYLDGLGTDVNYEQGARIMLLAGKAGSSEAVAFLKENNITAELLLGPNKKKKPTDPK